MKVAAGVASLCFSAAIALAVAPIRAEERAGQVQLAQAKSCFASEPDSDGASDLERSLRAAIRKSFERDAAPGLDGRVTVKFEVFQVGNKRAWGAPDMASFSTGDQTKPIYDVHAVFTSCTDYRTSINLVQRDRIFACFMDQFGSVSCQVTTGGPTPDKNQSFPK